MNDCDTSYVLESKLLTTDDVVLLRRLGGEIRVADVSCTDRNVVERCIGEQYSDTLSRYDPSVRAGLEVGRSMPVFHPACFAGKIHLDVEDEVAGGLRVPGWGAFALARM